jgi:hypothetical protein
MPDRVQAGHELAVLAEHLERAGAHAGHDPHADGHVGRVGDLDADVAIGEPSGPIENGTTYIVRPRIEPSKSSCSVARISSGSRQLLVGPASILALRSR